MSDHNQPNKGEYTREERDVLAKRFILTVTFVMVMILLIFFAPN